MFYIYKITNIVNNKVYIGQTNNHLNRWYRHKRSAILKDKTLLITKAMAKYGIDNFTYTVIAAAETRELINAAEIFYIKYYNSRNMSYGYNIATGGAFGQTPEMIAKIAASLREFYKTHFNAQKGCTHSKEWNENISKASIGKPGTNLGKQFNDDWKLRISNSLSGKQLVGRHRFSADIEKEICSLYESGMTKYKLAKKYKCSTSLIIAILIRYNIPTRETPYNKNNKCRFNKEQQLEICNRYINEKITRNGLSEIYNCGSTTIRGILLRNNVDLAERKYKEN